MLDAREGGLELAQCRPAWEGLGMEGGGCRCRAGDTLA